MFCYFWKFVVFFIDKDFFLKIFEFFFKSKQKEIFNDKETTNYSFYADVENFSYQLRQLSEYHELIELL